jgi:hypothetical protein
MQGVNSKCIQLPTTLPTLDEIIGSDGVDETNCWKSIFEHSQNALPHGHVYTLHAELEGMKLLPAMRTLLKHWVSSNTEFLTLEQLYDSLDLSTLPVHPVDWGEVEGRSGLLALQGPALADDTAAMNQGSPA